MNTFEQLTSCSSASAPAVHFSSPLSLSAKSESTGSSSVPDFGVPLPDLFSHPAYLDMPLGLDGLASQELVLEEAGDASQPVVYEEVIDFFVDATDPSKVLISRSGAPRPVSSIPLPAQAVLPVAPISGCLPRATSPRSSSGASLKRRHHTSAVLAPASDHKLAVKRERNRQAAERCRARRVNLITSLRAECEQLRADRERLIKENRLLMEALSAVGGVLPLQS